MRLSLQLKNSGTDLFVKILSIVTIFAPEVEILFSQDQIKARTSVADKYGFSCYGVCHSNCIFKSPIIIQSKAQNRVGVRINGLDIISKLKHSKPHDEIQFNLKVIEGRVVFEILRCSTDNCTFRDRLECNVLTSQDVTQFKFLLSSSSSGFVLPSKSSVALSRMRLLSIPSVSIKTFFFREIEEDSQPAGPSPTNPGTEVARDGHPADFSGMTAAAAVSSSTSSVGKLMCEVELKGECADCVASVRYPRCGTISVRKGGLSGGQKREVRVNLNAFARAIIFSDRLSTNKSFGIVLSRITFIAEDCVYIRNFMTSTFALLICINIIFQSFALDTVPRIVDLKPDLDVPFAYIYNMLNTKLDIIDYMMSPISENADKLAVDSIKSYSNSLRSYKSKFLEAVDEYVARLAEYGTSGGNNTDVAECVFHTTSDSDLWSPSNKNHGFPLFNLNRRECQETMEFVQSPSVAEEETEDSSTDTSASIEETEDTIARVTTLLSDIPIFGQYGYVESSEGGYEQVHVDELYEDVRVFVDTKSTASASKTLRYKVRSNEGYCEEPRFEVTHDAQKECHVISSFHSSASQDSEEESSEFSSPFPSLSSILENLPKSIGPLRLRTLFYDEYSSPSRENPIEINEDSKDFDWVSEDIIDNYTDMVEDLFQYNIYKHSFVIAYNENIAPILFTPSGSSTEVRSDNRIIPHVTPILPLFRDGGGNSDGTLDNIRVEIFHSLSINTTEYALKNIRLFESIILTLLDSGDLVSYDQEEMRMTPRGVLEILRRSQELQPLFTDINKASYFAFSALTTMVKQKHHETHLFVVVPNHKLFCNEEFLKSLQESFASITFLFAGWSECSNYIEGKKIGFVFNVENPPRNFPPLYPIKQLLNRPFHCPISLFSSLDDCTELNDSAVVPLPITTAGLGSIPFCTHAAKGMMCMVLDINEPFSVGPTHSSVSVSTVFSRIVGDSTPALYCAVPAYFDNTGNSRGVIGWDPDEKLEFDLSSEDAVSEYLSVRCDNDFISDKYGEEFYEEIKQNKTYEHSIYVQDVITPFNPGVHSHSLYFFPQSFVFLFTHIENIILVVGKELRPSHDWKVRKPLAAIVYNECQHYSSPIEEVILELIEQSKEGSILDITGMLEEDDNDDSSITEEFINYLSNDMECWNAMVLADRSTESNVLDETDFEYSPVCGVSFSFLNSSWFAGLSEDTRNAIISTLGNTVQYGDTTDLRSTLSDASTHNCLGDDCGYFEEIQYQIKLAMAHSRHNIVILALHIAIQSALTEFEVVRTGTAFIPHPFSLASKSPFSYGKHAAISVFYPPQVENPYLPSNDGGFPASFASHSSILAVSSRTGDRNPLIINAIAMDNQLFWRFIVSRRRNNSVDIVRYVDIKPITQTIPECSDETSDDSYEQINCDMTESNSFIASIIAQSLSEELKEMMLDFVFHRTALFVIIDERGYVVDMAPPLNASWLFFEYSDGSFSHQTVINRHLSEYADGIWGFLVDMGYFKLILSQDQSNSYTWKSFIYDDTILDVADVQGGVVFTKMSSPHLSGWVFLSRLANSNLHILCVSDLSYIQNVQLFAGSINGLVQKSMNVDVISHFFKDTSIEESYMATSYLFDKDLALTPELLHSPYAVTMKDPIKDSISAEIEGADWTKNENDLNFGGVLAFALGIILIFAVCTGVIYWIIDHEHIFLKKRGEYLRKLNEEKWFIEDDSESEDSESEILIDYVN
ncbi:hypothetical protein ADUPG1_013071 [Aduncisulcus paluster]|uniref:Uncharacterized protein n=1 Tax=Aduncisulcus paluster TaxID=2918883 RepID=A0ABQ5K3N6_9EUKA|nr:hypothetical protein ADUPG1_013071 [Aduncisulcus paluster]